MFEGILLNTTPIGLKLHVIRTLLKHEIPRAQLENGENLLKITAQRCEDLELELIPEIKFFIKNISVFEHGVVSCYLAGILIQTLNYESDRWKERIGLATLFHHLGCDPTLPKHAQKTLEIVSEIDGFDVAILQAIEHHHERASSLPYRMAEIVGMVSALATLFEKHRLGEIIDPLHAFNEKHIHEYSQTLASAFRSSFLKLSE